MATTNDLTGLGMAPELANYLGHTPDSVTAAGTAATTATVLRKNPGFVVVTAAGSQDGVKFNDSWPIGRPVFVVNPSSTTANIYPPLGGNWNGGSTDATITLAQNKVRLFIRQSTTLCYSILTA